MRGMMNRCPSRIRRASGAERTPGRCGLGTRKTWPGKAHAGADFYAQNEIVRPTPAECAKTLVDSTNQGTICTVCEDGWPLGTQASYILDDDGQPVVRLRKGAVHTENVSREPRCSLYVQPSDQAGEANARVTLIGKLEDLEENELRIAKIRFEAEHQGEWGVNKVNSCDLYSRMRVERIYYVGGYGTTATADIVSGEDFLQACSDPLKDCAREIRQEYNTKRLADLLRLCSEFAGFRDGIESVEMINIDRLGFDVLACVHGEMKEKRIQFPREMRDERDAKSNLTMMSQLSWERERNYTPAPMTSVSNAVEE